MKALAVCMLLLGAIAFWSVRVWQDRAAVREESQSNALAINYGQFRNAVIEYALHTKTAGPILPDALTLPTGWKAMRSWQGLVEAGEDGRLCCYVYGPAGSYTQMGEVQRLFLGSRAVGWNDGGFFMRNGMALPLPPTIPDGALVSVIALD